MTMTLAIFMPIMCVRWSFDQAARKPGSDGVVGIGFRCSQGDDALLFQTMLQPQTKAAGDQQLDAIERVRRVVIALMKALR